MGTSGCCSWEPGTPVCIKGLFRIHKGPVRHCPIREPRRSLICESLLNRMKYFAEIDGEKGTSSRGRL